MSLNWNHLVILGALATMCGCLEDEPGQSSSQADDDDQGVEWNGDVPVNAAVNDCVAMGGRCQSPDSVCDVATEFTGYSSCGDQPNNACCLPTAPIPQDPEAAPTVVVEDVLGSWVTALGGSSGTFYDWLVFEAPDHVDFIAEWHAYGDPEERAIEYTGVGSFEISPEGVVSYGLDLEAPWGSTYQSDRHTFTPLTIEQVERFVETAWSYETPEATRFWSFRGYIAQDATDQRFRREHMVHVESEERVLRHRGFTTELTFDAPLGAMLNSGDDCQIRVDIAVEVDDSEGVIQRGAESFELNCRVELDEAIGMGRISIEGLGDQNSDWSNYLFDMPFFETYSNQVFYQIQRAFSPVMFFEPEDTHALHHRPSHDDALVFTPDSPPSTSSSQ